MTPSPIPVPDPQAGLKALQAMLRERHPLAAMQVFHESLGNVFRINLPGFTPIVMVGPEAARFVLVSARDDLRWRNERDPVTALLRHGVLVEDGEQHDYLRTLMSPSLHRRMLDSYVARMVAAADQVMQGWNDGDVVDFLVEMRKIALLILTDTLFDVDYSPHLKPLWKAVLATIGYISPGVWMIWRNAPRPGYQQGIKNMDAYLYQIIADRRRTPVESNDMGPDLLSALVASGMDDDLIRDQLLTMLIAGHDTSTALLAWSLYLLGMHPDSLNTARLEVDAVLGPADPDPENIRGLSYLGRVTREALRLYPPIHLGSRVAAQDLVYQDYVIPKGERVIYSIYLTQRDKNYWDDPHTYRPERHLPGNNAPAYSWLAFGGGPRNCIGAAFGQIETKIVLARLLQHYDFELVKRHVHPHMGATLEPRPGVIVRIAHRNHKA